MMNSKAFPTYKLTLSILSFLVIVAAPIFAQVSANDPDPSISSGANMSRIDEIQKANKEVASALTQPQDDMP
ncbi:MAG: hypothetical protein EBR32_02150, partial [Bacteroidetes bacterium]|nr:hypothetical protein [Bacteroidota bacterium]